MKKYFTTPWQGKETLLIVAETIILIIAALIISEFFEFKALIESESTRFNFVIGSFLLLWAILILPLLIHTGLKHNLKSENFGFNKFSLKKTIIYTLSAYIGYHILNMLIVVFMLYTDIRIPGYQTQKFFLPLIGDNNFYLLILGFVTILLGPIIEEVFFRGFLLRAFCNKIGLIFGSISSTLLFTLLHFQFEVFFPILILGLIINHLVIKTNSIYTAIVFHMLNNAVVFTVEVLVLKEIINVENFL